LTIGEDRKSQVVLVDEKKIGDYEISDGTVINLKDLGPQIGWRTVFILEYLGALLLYPVFWIPQVRAIAYGDSTHWVPHIIQTYALACWTLHYVKRELETIFVHKFSKGTMPAFNLLKNSGYYWMAAVAVSFFVNHPKYLPPSLEKANIALGFFVLFEFLNFITHIQLANMRPGNEKRYVIPRGLWWNWMTCPNYTFEVASWVSFSVMTQTVAAYIFAFVGFAQMLAWAKGKHSRLCKEFPPGKNSAEVFPRRRKLLIPFLL